MEKKYFAYPYVLLTRGGIGEGGQPEPEVGSAHGTPDDPYPCSYANWVQLFGADLYGNDGVINFDDYRQWWSNNFGSTGWSDYNGSTSQIPGDPFPNP